MIKMIEMRTRSENEESDTNAVRKLGLGALTPRNKCLFVNLVCPFLNRVRMASVFVCSKDGLPLTEGLIFFSKNSWFLY